MAVVLTGAAIFVSHFYLSYNKFKADAKELSIVAKDYDVLQKQLQLFVEKKPAI